jgi:hypothetical protein
MMTPLVLVLSLSAVPGFANAQACPGKQWEVTPPSSSGWSEQQLGELEKVLKSLDTTALVIAHKGKIVF